ncbi:MAG: DUF4440 domain-containing protein [Rhodospirillaceae bacterium]|nr:DUF4440 domain-containing protein [Rhodospirillaceae bacterium]
MSEANEVEAVIRGIFRDFMDHKPGAIEERQHPDCTVWDVFTPDLIRGLEERKKFHAKDQQQMQARGPLTLNVDAPVVDAWDNVAVARYYVMFSYAAPNPTAGRVRVTSVFRKIDGRWLMVHHHEGLVPTGHPPIEPPAGANST